MEKRFKRNFGRSIRSVSQLKIYKYLTKKISSNVEAALRYRLLVVWQLLSRADVPYGCPTRTVSATLLRKLC